MSKKEKFLAKLISGKSDRSIRFLELRSFLLAIGFDERIKGGHYVYTHVNLKEILTLQPAGDKAKSYQIRQVRQALKKLGGNMYV